MNYEHCFSYKTHFVADAAFPSLSFAEKIKVSDRLIYASYICMPVFQSSIIHEEQIKQLSSYCSFEINFTKPYWIHVLN